MPAANQDIGQGVGLDLLGQLAHDFCKRETAGAHGFG